MVETNNLKYFIIYIIYLYMYKKFLKSFVIGSSMLVTISHYDSLKNYINNKMVYNRYDKDKKLELFHFYVIFAPD